jgi:NADH-quinone oxidoreductase subunit N
MNEFKANLPEILDQVIRSIPFFKPELALIMAFLTAIIVSLFVDKHWKNASFVVAILGMIASSFFLIPQIDQPSQAFFGMLVLDNFSVYARFIILFSLIISTILLQQHFRKKTTEKRLGDIYSILLAAGMGLHLLTLTSNWLMAFIAIETVSISSYILVGFFSEAAMKYMLFGSVSAAAMLYGLSLLYGFTGDLDFTSAAHLQGLMTAPEVLCTIAVLFMLIGIGFKLGFVPFHLWSPDVYEGAPTPITAFLTTVPKVAALILFSRLIQAWIPVQFHFGEITSIFVVVVSIVTMLVGNMIALRQQNIKRMMAYSSIGHIGFLLMLLLAITPHNQEILLFYLAIYCIMNLAIFSFADVLDKAIGSTEIPDYAGLGKKYPILFTCFTFVGIALVGLPPTAGFIGKILVFSAIYEVYHSKQEFVYIILLAVGALTSVISLFYYFKIPLYAFLKKGDKESATTFNLPRPVWIIAVVLSISLLFLFIFPDILLNFFI